MRRLAAVLVLAAGLPALAGCGGTAGAHTASTTAPKAATPSAESTPSAVSGASSITSMPKPCSLVDAATAGSELGRSVTARDSSAQNDPDNISCIYLVNGKTPALVIRIRALSQADFSTSVQKQPVPMTEAPGYGVLAYTGTSGKDPFVLAWQRGVEVTVLATDGVGADGAERFTRSALAALAKA